MSCLRWQIPFLLKAVQRVSQRDGGIPAEISDACTVNGTWMEDFKKTFNLIPNSAEPTPGGVSSGSGESREGGGDILESINLRLFFLDPLTLGN